MFARIRALWALIQLSISIPITILLMYVFNAHHRAIRRTWAKLQSTLLGYTLLQKGAADPEAKLIIMNHQSLLDIVVMEALHPGNPCWVAKKEVEKIPVFGHIMHPPKMISIDRSDRRSMVKLLKEAKVRIGEGRVIAIFPEGTRGKGGRLLKFQVGAKALAEKLNLTVQPVIITGTRQVLDSQHFKANGGTVCVTFLESVNPASDPLWYEHIKETMEKALEDELANTSRHR
ncbi:MAG: 1-acyl-sn-glycerol-3-phosphate acyltransferase [Campylobacterales bacterium]|nr:1-acyl-sn-glycerol-3-phosphate acyltransferase [Campylobacterales bacterium]